MALVLDGAGWHTSSALVLPDGLDLIPWPPASLERQPAARRWPLVHEPVANRACADLEAREDVLVGRCRTLRADRTTIRDLTHSHGWPSDAPLAIPQ